MMTQRLLEEVKYGFTREEMLDLAQRLAQATQKVFDLEREKSETNSLLNSHIKEANNRVAELTLKVSNGYELREVEAIVSFHDPRPGMKRIISAVTSEVLREEKMTPEEMQQNLDFGTGEP